MALASYAQPRDSNFRVRTPSPLPHRHRFQARPAPVKSNPSRQYGETKASRLRYIAKQGSVPNDIDLNPDAMIIHTRDRWAEGSEEPSIRSSESHLLRRGRYGTRNYDRNIDKQPNSKSEFHFENWMETITGKLDSKSKAQKPPPQRRMKHRQVSRDDIQRGRRRRNTNNNETFVRQPVSNRRGTLVKPVESLPVNGQQTVDNPIFIRPDYRSSESAKTQPSWLKKFFRY